MDELTDGSRASDAAAFNLERESARRQVEMARVELRLLDAAAIVETEAAAMPGVRGTPSILGAMVTRRIKTAMLALDETDRLLAAPADTAAPKRRACPFCARQVVANATLCGYCWRRLDTTGRA
jgi:hypothetical protein